MTLTLRAISLNSHPLTQPITAHFDPAGGSIGRSDHNTLALPDPERHISRQHAEISLGEGGYRIKNVGSANPILVRGQALARGESAPLMHRDQVRIGGYLLEVIQEDGVDSEATNIVRGRAAVDAATPGVIRRSEAVQGASLAPRASPPGGASGLGELNTPLSPSNPFASLLGESVPAPSVQPGVPPMPALAAQRVVQPNPAELWVDPFSNSQPAAAGVSAASAAWARPPAPPSRALLPDDFDPFAAPAPAPAIPPPTPSTGAGLFEDLIPSAASASIDQMFGLERGERDPLADFMANLAPPPRAGGTNTVIGSAGLSTDPLALFGPAQAPSPRADGLPTAADHVPELHAAFVPPAPRVLPAEQPPPGVELATARAAAQPTREQAIWPAPVPTGHTWSGDPHELWAAFCDGAGIGFEPPQGINPELMRVAGALLNSAVAGTLQLMMVRATAKHELRAQVTVIRARNNNPLKFSPDARSALEQLLQPPIRGFLAGPAAITDAMQDLVGHAIGTMAGTRAALEGVLDRFTPRQLEAKLVGKSVLDTVLPMNRKAKLWELYLQNFEVIHDEAHDDFHSLFGRAFLAAYEQQLERLQQEEYVKA